MGIEGECRRRDLAKKRRVRVAETVGAAGFLLDRARRPAHIFPTLQEKTIEGRQSQQRGIHYAPKQPATATHGRSFKPQPPRQRELAGRFRNEKTETTTTTHT